MTTRSILAQAAAVAALSFVAFGASAEEYQGVLQLHSTTARSAVRADGIAAAHSADPYAEGASAGAPAVVAGLSERAQVRAEAFAAARAGNIYGDAAFNGPDERFVGTLARATVRAQAVAAAHGIDNLPL